MLTENEIIEHVMEYLKGLGFRIVSSCKTSQKGYDIVAENQSSEKWIIEAKGGTSSLEDSPRYGLGFTPNQVKTHVGVAIIKSFQTKVNLPCSKVSIALPDNEDHQCLIASIEKPLLASGITVLFVKKNGGVYELSSV